MNTALTSWMLYAAGVAALLGLGALLAESALRQIGAAHRWVWGAAMAGAVLVPVATLLGLPGLLRPATPLPDGGLIVLPPLVVGGAEGGSAALSIDAILLAAWGTVSVALILYVALSVARLWRARRGWRVEHVGGVPVLLTSDIGPAALGRSILLPEWALAADARLRRLMLMHEEEHVRAGDPWLLLAGLTVAVALPWNVVLWWMLSRMRQAVELDCDARVLRREPDARLYGTLLVEVGRRRGGPRLVVAFSEPRTVLERRILAIATGVHRNRRRAAGLAVASVLVVALAVCAGDPLRPGTLEDTVAPEPQPAIEPDVQAAVVTEVVADRADPAEGPVFTPMTVAPELRNRAAVVEALRQNYPPLLRDAGIGGNPTVWFYIDQDGRVQRTMLDRSSGYSQLDDAALRIAGIMEFTPALNRDERVAVWVSIPIVFQPRAAQANTESPARPEAGGRPPVRAERDAQVLAERAFREFAERARRSVGRSADELGEQPSFTPMTTAPMLLNRQDVAQALERFYPPLLRDAGMGGTATVWFLIDEHGATRTIRLDQSSGHDELDRAALSVADRMRFAPALHREDRTAVWVSIPIVFQAR